MSEETNDNLSPMNIAINQMIRDGIIEEKDVKPGGRFYGPTPKQVANTALNELLNESNESNKDDKINDDNSDSDNSYLQYLSDVDEMEEDIIVYRQEINDMINCEFDYDENITINDRTFDCNKIFSNDKYPYKKKHLQPLSGKSLVHVIVKLYHDYLSDCHDPYDDSINRIFNPHEMDMFFERNNY
jgi:hypothetical protein